MSKEAWIKIKLKPGSEIQEIVIKNPNSYRKALKHYYIEKGEFMDFKVICDILGTTTNNIIDRWIKKFIRDNNSVLIRAIIRKELNERQEKKE